MACGPGFAAGAAGIAAGAAAEGLLPVRVEQPGVPAAVDAFVHAGHLVDAAVQGIVPARAGEATQGRPHEAVREHAGIVALGVSPAVTGTGMLRAMTPDHARQLDALETLVRSFDRHGKSRRQFWDEFEALAGDMEQLAFAADADPELSNRYTDILAMADDAGYAGPDDQLDDVMP